MFSRLTQFSRALGRGRNAVRRLSALALLVLGVHAAGLVVDDVVFGLVDRVDLALDRWAFAAYAWLAEEGAYTAQAAAARATRLAHVVDLAEKEHIAHALSFVVELLMIGLLAPFAWGAREALVRGERSRLEALTATNAMLRDALWPLDVERVAAPLALAGFALSAAFSAGLALETAAYGALSAAFPLWPWASQAAAFSAFVTAIVLVWRFMPDLLFGAVIKGAVRAERAAAKRAAAGEARPTTPWRARLASIRAGIARYGRGLPTAALCVPLAAMGLMAQTAAWHMLARMGVL